MGTGKGTGKRELKKELGEGTEGTGELATNEEFLCVRCVLAKTEPEP